MIEQYTSPAVVNNSQEPWLVGEGVSLSGSIAIPSLDFDFVTSGLPGTVTFTRASTATYFNSSGTLTSAAINEARLDYNPSTLAARGLLIEEQRTNSIRNNTMQGAVAGTPGTVPTNWAVSPSGSGITREIVGTGTENGITYIDIKYSGTPSATVNFDIGFDSTIGIAASNGQTWTTSVYPKIVAGNSTNIVFTLFITGRDSGGSLVSGQVGQTAVTLDSSALGQVRPTATFTMSSASVANVFAFFRLAVTSGAAIDITLRIGLPQLEQGAFATSVIPTTTTALTRNADVASVNTLSPWYNAAESTLYLEFTPVGLKSVSGQPLLEIDNGTVNERIRMLATSFNGMQNATTVSGATSGNNTTPTTTYVAGSTYKIAAAIKLDDMQSFAGGAAGTIDTTTLLPVGLTTLRFASNVSASPLSNVWLRRFTYYPRRLSQAEGIAITA